MKITPEIIEKIKQAKEEWLSFRKIRDKVSKEINQNLTYHNVRDAVISLWLEVTKIQNDLKDLNETLEEWKHYEITDDYYIFYQNRTNNIWEKEKVKYPIAISTVDSIFKDYSKHWNNLSWEEILQKYEIKPELFFLLKNRLRLFKSSHVLSPATMDKLTDEELQKHIDWAIDEHITDRYKSKFVKTFEKKKNDDYIKKSKILSNIDYVLEHIQDFLKEYKSEPVKIIRDKEPKNNDSILVWISDLHIWKQRTNNVLTRLSKITTDLINRPEKNIMLFFRWDNAETLARWGMHPWQLESMDWPFEFDLLMKCFEEIKSLVLSLYKSWKNVEFVWWGWNHWRFTKESKDSMNWIWDLIIYELLKQSVNHLWISVKILKDEWSNFEFDWINYITHHWDNFATNKNPSTILWEKWKQNKPNIILFGDKHHLEMFDCQSDAIKIIIPSISWSNEYDKSKLLASYPWYTIISKNSDWVPDTYIRRFAMD